MTFVDWLTTSYRGNHLIFDYFFENVIDVGG